MIRGAVLGSPISHSLSPVLYQGAFAFLGVDGRYEAIDVPSGTFADFFTNRSSEFDYFSLTMPLKEEALSLDILFDDLSKRIGSANMLYRKDGGWRGTSTDGSGFVSSLAASSDRAFSNALILGAGGTARAIAGAIDSLIPSISILGRTSTRRDALARCVQSSTFEYLTWSDSFDLSEYDLVINTTPAGAADLLAENLPPSISALLFDVIYTPWPTVLASRWSDRSGQVINGKELLLWQGIDQLERIIEISVNRLLLAPHLRELLAPR
jgi:shikimate dehydrogenase